MVLPETIEQQLALLKALADRPLTLPPVFVDIAGSINAGLLLSQIVYWTKKNSERDPAGEGWFFVVLPKFQEQMRMTKHEMESARKSLRSKQFIDWDLRGTPPKLFFRADLREILIAVNFQLSGNRRINYPQSEQSGNRKVGVRNPENCHPETGKSILRNSDSSNKEQETKKQETNQETSQERVSEQPVQKAAQQLFPTNGHGKKPGLSQTERDSWDLRRWREEMDARAPQVGVYVPDKELEWIERARLSAFACGVTIDRIQELLRPFFPSDPRIEQLDPNRQIKFESATP